VLEFNVLRLSVGTVLLFDDWRCYRNLADFGQQRACREWLERNPKITLNEFVDFGFHGQAFTVASC
jgi:O-methyltransferase